jgi:hypothetical protein
MTITAGRHYRDTGQSNKARKAGRVNIETALKDAMTIDGAVAHVSSKANPALARHNLKRIEGELSV